MKTALFRISIFIGIFIVFQVNMSEMVLQEDILILTMLGYLLLMHWIKK